MAKLNVISELYKESIQTVSVLYTMSGKVPSPRIACLILVFVTGLSSRKLKVRKFHGMDLVLIFFILVKEYFLSFDSMIVIFHNYIFCYKKQFK